MALIYWRLPKARKDADELLELNPHLRQGITPPDGEDFALAVPRSMRAGSRLGSGLRTDWAAKSLSR